MPNPSHLWSRREPLRILIAGTVHPDPTCRQALRDLFRHRKSVESEAPVFIAVEADHDHFVEIRGQREGFEREAKKTWPELSDDLIAELACTLLFEADTHLEYFPQADVVWLDRGRSLPQPDAVSRFSERRLSCYDMWIQRRRATAAGFETSSVLRYLSSAAKLAVRDGPPEKDPARDARWYDEMRPHLDLSSDRHWGIIVCGAEHGLAEAGNIAELLLLAGHDVKSVDLVHAL